MFDAIDYYQVLQVQPDAIWSEIYSSFEFLRSIDPLCETAYLTALCYLADENIRTHYDDALRKLKDKPNYRMRIADESICQGFYCIFTEMSPGFEASLLFLVEVEPELPQTVFYGNTELACKQVKQQIANPEVKPVSTEVAPPEANVLVPRIPKLRETYHVTHAVRRSLSYFLKLMPSRWNKPLNSVIDDIVSRIPDRVNNLRDIEQLFIPFDQTASLCLKRALVRWFSMRDVFSYDLNP
jgi:hypothetical protein